MFVLQYVKGLIMVGALWTGISGLAGSQTALDNESNNIANVNTIGYKSSRISFADQMYQDKIGKGVTSFDVEKLYTQGNLKLTGVSYDMALSGDGFFQVSDGRDVFYTRAGNFRMGESGTLEDVGKNKVQGWSMAPVTPDDITSTDPNASKFTNDFSKLLGNKIIRDTTSIETIIAKATDYTSTAVSDPNSIYTGAGYKTASTKIADVELLISEYNSLLTTHSNADPKPTASTSRVQKDFMDFELNDAANVLGTGDEMYVYIDGTKYSQSFDTDESTTMKKFADKLSNTAGFRASFTTNAYAHTSPTGADPSGGIYIEGLIPGKSYRITEFGWTDASNSNQATKGDVITVQTAVEGTGMGAIGSIRDALAETVSGKQMDVYTASDLTFNATAANNDYSYQITIYDNDLEANVTVPTNALTVGLVDIDIAAPDVSTAIDQMAAAINATAAATAVATEMAYYVKAYNINGNLVVKTLDKNNDVEFTGTMLKLPSTATSEVQTLTVAGAATGQVTFLGRTVANADGTAGHQTGAEIAADIVADQTGIIAVWNAANPTQEILTITNVGAVLTLTYKDTEGDVPVVPAAASAGSTFAVSIQTTEGIAGGIKARNASYSGREGAGAEFLEISTTINQTASKSDLQLRLDSLTLTDSAFGDFSVDATGLITMKQDGTDYAVGQIAVAKFTDKRGLSPMGDNLLKSTNRSGAAIFNVNNDKTADVKGGTLELSTADLSESLVNLMVFQRAFEANAKSITTADQILTTLIQLKR